MARNEEKHYGRLNRLYLLKEKEEYEKANPKRPRLETLCTAEEVQKWLPSIKKDIDFYLKKTQVTCYSDAHVEESREKVIKLEKEFKAFVRKIKQLNPSPLDAIPWTGRPYKRKKTNDNLKENPSKEFNRIATPILQNEIPNVRGKTTEWNANSELMNKPLSFSNMDKEIIEPSKTSTDTNFSSNCNFNQSQHCVSINNFPTDDNDERKITKLEKSYSIVNYDSSDCDDL